MIKISLENIFVIYVCFFIFFILFLVIFIEIRRRIRENRVRREFLICSICEHVYKDKSKSALAICTECGSLNERVYTKEI